MIIGLLLILLVTTFETTELVRSREGREARQREQGGRGKERARGASRSTFFFGFPTDLLRPFVSQSITPSSPVLGCRKTTSAIISVIGHRGGRGVFFQSLSVCFVFSFQPAIPPVSIFFFFRFYAFSQSRFTIVPGPAAWPPLPLFSRLIVNVDGLKSRGGGGIRVANLRACRWVVDGRWIARDRYSVNRSYREEKKHIAFGC